eukprot:scaffold180082_cov32-Tisochrysis_lutea.AAC.2
MSYAATYALCFDVPMDCNNCRNKKDATAARPPALVPAELRMLHALMCRWPTTALPRGAQIVSHPL